MFLRKEIKFNFRAIYLAESKRFCLIQNSKSRINLYVRGDGTTGLLDLSKLISLASFLESVPSLIDSNRALQREVVALREELKGKASPVGKRFYNLKEAAKALNASETTVRRYLERGVLRRSFAQGKIQIPALEIENFGAKTI